MGSTAVFQVKCWLEAHLTSGLVQGKLVRAHTNEKKLDPKCLVCIFGEVPREHSYLC